MLAENYYVSELLDRYGAVLSEKQFRILDGYYNDDLSLSEIAENEGITRQGVRDFVKRCEQQLMEWEEKLRLCEKAKQLKLICEKLQNGECDIKELEAFAENF